jgi:hypothetical protein
MKTLIIIILDESGSMGTKKLDVIGGYNSFINDQKKIKNDIARLYLVKFNTVVTTVHKGFCLLYYLYYDLVIDWFIFTLIFTQL